MNPDQSLIAEMFNKDLYSLTIEDIKEYFAIQREETDVREFKSYVDYVDRAAKSQRDNDKMHSIIKTLCAFLNSEGGVLIWGAPEDKSGVSGELKLVDVTLRKDQVIEKITSQIAPVPYAIKFRSIEGAEGKYCYIFEVAKSEHRPHQYRGTYYMRLDGATKPAPHTCVEALMKRITYPRLAGVIEFGQFNVSLQSHFCYVPIIIGVFNQSEFIHEKNLHIRLSSNFGCLKQITDPVDPHLRLLGFNYTQNAGDFLWYGIPYIHPFLFVMGYENYKYTTVRITLDVLGERSPALRSVYEYGYGWKAENAFASSFHNTVESKKENFYLFDDSERSDMSEMEKMKLKNHFEVNALNANVSRHPIVNI